MAWGLVLAAASASSPTQGPGAPAFPNLPAVGDGENLWVLRPDALSPIKDGGVQVWHRGRHDTAGVLRRGPRLTSAKLAPRGLAASAGRLWVVFDNLRCHSYLAVPGPTPGLWSYDGRVEATLPAPAVLRALGAHRAGAWALITTLSPAQPAPGPQTEPTTTEKPPASGASKDKTGRGSLKGAKPEDEARPALAAGPGATDRLLRMAGREWKPAPLPEDWPQGGAAWLLFRDAEQSLPVLAVAAPADAADDAVWLYAGEGDPQAPVWRKWVVPSAALQAATGARFSLLSAWDQVVLAERTPDPSRLEIAVTVVRPRSVLPLGKLSLDGVGAADSWAPVAADHHLALLAAPSQGNVRSQYMDSTGKVSSGARGFEPSNRPAGGDPLPYLVMVVSLIFASAVMVVFWKRDPRWNTLELPRTVSLSDLASRSGAAVVDLVPAVALAMMATGSGPREVLAGWPGLSSSAGWQAMAPGAAALLAFVVLGLVGELFLGQTLGKRFFNLNVADLRGRRPQPWQLVVRNLAKALDLVAWPLLILVVITPNRQRLGDLVARTVVIVGQVSRPEGAGDESSDGGGPEGGG